MNLQPTIEEPIHYDGAAWTFEGMSNGEYYFVNRKTPSDELNQLFRKMFDLSDIKTEQEYYLQPIPPNL